MHDIAFKMKRAFQSTLRVTRPLFEALGLTAARFDMLYAIGEAGDWAPRQSQLQETLGVSAPTVSRMLGSLERLELVTRRPLRWDTRQRIVELTERGREVLHQATRLLCWSCTVERLLLDVLTPGSTAHPEVRRLDAFDALDYRLILLCKGFGDTGSLRYPSWHPDD